MTRWMGSVGVFTGLMLAGVAFGQQSQAADAVAAGGKVKEVKVNQAESIDSRPVKTFYLANSSDANGGNEIVTALRLMLEPTVKLYLTPEQNCITIRAREDQIALAQRLIAELDRPKKQYRLTFTLTQMEGGTRIGLQHFAISAAAGMRSTLKQGSKIPVVTGSTSQTSGTQTQFQYLDVGINLDVTPEEYAGGVRLKIKVEDSSLAEDKLIAAVEEPVVRQTTLEGSSFAVLGKPLVLGSLDTPGSTRHTEVEVLVEVVK